MREPARIGASGQAAIPLEAFAFIIPRWQEARHRSGSGLVAMAAYHNEIGAGRASYTRRSSVVAPCISDFVADVELQVRKALSPEELAWFFEFYGDGDGQLDEVPTTRTALDAKVRQKCGRRFCITSKWEVQDGEEVMVFRGVDLYVPFKEVRCYAEVNPLGRYMASVDVHGPRTMPRFQDVHVYHEGAGVGA